MLQLMVPQRETVTLRHRKPPENALSWLGRLVRNGMRQECVWDPIGPLDLPKTSKFGQRDMWASGPGAPHENQYLDQHPILLREALHGLPAEGDKYSPEPPKGFIIRHRWQQTGNSVEGVRNAHSTSSPRGPKQIPKTTEPGAIMALRLPSSVCWGYRYTLKVASRIRVASPSSN